MLSICERDNPVIVMKWETLDDDSVVDSSKWLPLAEYKQLRSRSGVYVFIDSASEVWYVGKAGAGRMVEEVKNAIDRGKGKGANQVAALYTNGDEAAKTLESKLIDHYQPENNKQK